MLITNIIDRCNKTYIVSDYIRAPEIYMYMDRAIMDINERMQTTFPMMSDWVSFCEAWNAAYPENLLDQSNYTAIPDSYIGSVLLVGTAFYFYTKDEEGEMIAQGYLRKYEESLFAMLRDYSMLVPEAFQNNAGGFIQGIDYEEYATGGRHLDGFNY